LLALLNPKPENLYVLFFLIGMMVIGLVYALFIKKDPRRITDSASHDRGSPPAGSTAGSKPPVPVIAGSAAKTLP
jgi:hypothetical protein